VFAAAQSVAMRRATPAAITDVVAASGAAALPTTKGAATKEKVNDNFAYPLTLLVIIGSVCCS
jgi:hypothetical protein